MYIGIGTLLIIVWFIGGVIYREKLFFEAALFRGNQYNELVKVIEEEFGEYAVSKAVSKHKVSLYCDPPVMRGKWGVRMGW
jgi:hypothetical protein